MNQKYNQYTKDIFSKLDHTFEQGGSLLDVGCGPAVDSQYLREQYKLNVHCTDLYKHENIDLFNIPFTTGSILDLPFDNHSYDYCFLHDVLHHIDEKNQSKDMHRKALFELQRVTKRGGYVIIIEGNRFNPLFYPHMVKMLGHDHFTQEYFKSLIGEVFEAPTYKFFEAHLYPQKFLLPFKVYEFIMEHYIPKNFIAYNCAIIKV